ncbi:MAG: DUF3800 domain-containing protein [Patescibacteria group bacterium]
MENKTITPGPKDRNNLFGFLDETGNIHELSGVFGVGLLSIDHPSEIHRLALSYRDRKNYRAEFKFADIRSKNVDLYKGFLDLFFSAHNIKFYCILYDESKLDIKKHFKGDCDKAYNSFSSRLISKSLGISDYIAVLADDRSTKKSDNFEKEMREKIKKKERRDALFGVCRLESHAVSEIQMVDLLLGTVAFAFKIKMGLIKNMSKHNGKLQIVKYLQNKLDIDVLSEEVNRKLRNGNVFYIEDFFKKNDGAVGSMAN